MCFDQLRVKALKLGGNAIIATDIEYGEAGASKGMLMVCAAGTAIRIKNAEVLVENKEIVEKLLQHTLEIKRLSKYKDIVDDY